MLVKSSKLLVTRIEFGQLRKAREATMLASAFPSLAVGT